MPLNDHHTLDARITACTAMYGAECGSDAGTMTQHRLPERESMAENCKIFTTISHQRRAGRLGSAGQKGTSRAMTAPFEFSQRPITLGNQTEHWGIRKSGLTFSCVRNDQHCETGEATQAVAFFMAGRDDSEVQQAARDFVGTVDAALGNWPVESRDRGAFSITE